MSAAGVSIAHSLTNLAEYTWVSKGIAERDFKAKFDGLVDQARDKCREFGLCLAEAHFK